MSPVSVSDVISREGGVERREASLAAVSLSVFPSAGEKREEEEGGEEGGLTAFFNEQVGLTCFLAASS